MKTYRPGSFMFMQNTEDFLIENSYFTNCTSSGFGGGFFLTEMKNLTILNTEISKIRSPLYGGVKFF